MHIDDMEAQHMEFKLYISILSFSYLCPIIGRLSLSKGRHVCSLLNQLWCISSYGMTHHVYILSEASKYNIKITLTKVIKLSICIQKWWTITKSSSLLAFMKQMSHFSLNKIDRISICSILNTMYFNCRMLIVYITYAARYIHG